MMNCLKSIKLSNGLLFISTLTTVSFPFYANAELNNNVIAQNTEYHQDLTVNNHFDNSSYLATDDSGILNIEHTAFAVIRLKKTLPAGVQFSLNGEAVVFQKVNSAGTVLKCEVDNFRDKWLEITGPQIDIRQLLSFKD
ncbi:hypothetical protein [Spartinivicinus ruber]|uniref:hypothetical protein n=1 Tax=Spartinivicinus ruber TaxID=2683272 RepID=UPI0013D0F691|nr:hypothetical protein [Spartinivicinus ruber]